MFGMYILNGPMPHHNDFYDWDVGVGCRNKQNNEFEVLMERQL